MKTLLLILSAALVWADGGTVLLRQQSAGMWITVFAAPSDLSVLVQDTATLAPVLDADVVINLSGGAELKATHDAAQNKLLYAVAMNRGGDFDVSVRRGSDVASVSGTWAATPPRGTLSEHWGALSLPPIAILLFALNRRLRRSQAFDRSA